MDQDKISLTVDGRTRTLAWCLTGFIYAGKDKRDFPFNGMKIGGVWRVSAGCRYFTISQARRHWGKGGESDRPDCLELVEKIAAEAASRDAPVAA